MVKRNEVSNYLSEHGWYKRWVEYNKDETVTHVFKNSNIEAFGILVKSVIKTGEIVKVWVDIDLKYDDFYLIRGRKDLENFIESLNVVREALAKIENELVKPMCKKFNLPFVNKEIREEKFGYIDVRDIKEWLKNEIKDISNK